MTWLKEIGAGDVGQRLNLVEDEIGAAHLPEAAKAGCGGNCGKQKGPAPPVPVAPSWPNEDLWEKGQNEKAPYGAQQAGTYVSKKKMKHSPKKAQSDLPVDPMRKLQGLTPASLKVHEKETGPLAQPPAGYGIWESRLCWALGKTGEFEWAAKQLNVGNWHQALQLANKVLKVILNIWEFGGGNAYPPTQNQVLLDNPCSTNISVLHASYVADNPRWQDDGYCGIVVSPPLGKIACNIEGGLSVQDCIPVALVLAAVFQHDCDSISPDLTECFLEPDFADLFVAGPYAPQLCALYTEILVRGHMSGDTTFSNLEDKWFDEPEFGIGFNIGAEWGYALANDAIFLSGPGSIFHCINEGPYASQCPQIESACNLECDYPFALNQEDCTCECALGCPSSEPLDEETCTCGGPPDEPGPMPGSCDDFSCPGTSIPQLLQCMAELIAILVQTHDTNFCDIVEYSDEELWKYETLYLFPFRMKYASPAFINNSAALDPNWTEGIRIYIETPDGQLLKNVELASEDCACIQEYYALYDKLCDAAHAIDDTVAGCDENPLNAMDFTFNGEGPEDATWQTMLDEHKVAGESHLRR